LEILIKLLRSEMCLAKSKKKVWGSRYLTANVSLRPFL
jgi:hypothetical protein